MDERRSRRQQRAQQLHQPDRLRDRQRRRGKCEQGGFRQELPKQAAWTSAKRDPDGDFVLSLDGTRQKELRRVDTGNQKNQTDRAEQQQHDGPAAAADDLPERRHAHREPEILSIRSAPVELRVVRAGDDADSARISAAAWSSVTPGFRRAIAVTRRTLANSPARDV